MGVMTERTVAPTPRTNPTRGPLVARLSIAGGDHGRVDEPVDVRLEIVNRSGATVRMVGVIGGSEGGARHPRYLPVVRRDRIVVASADPASHGGLPPLREVDIVVLHPGDVFDPCAPQHGAAFAPLATFVDHRPDRPGRYRYEITIDTGSAEPHRWLAPEQVGDRAGVLALLREVPHMTCTASVELDVS